MRRRAVLVRLLALPVLVAGLLAAGPSAQAAGSALTVTVGSDDTGAPVSGACVQVWTLPTQLDYHLVGQACAGGDGVVAVDGLTAGTQYTVSVTAAGFRSEWAQDASMSGATPYTAPAAVTVGLARRSAALAGTVTRTDGTPVNRADIQVVPHAHEPLGENYWAVTGNDGRWSIGQVVPGTYDVRASVGTGPSVSGTVTVAKGATGVVDLALPLPASVTGRITTSDGAALAGACVSATSDGGTGTDRVCTGTDGTYRIGDLVAATWTVTASDPSGRYAAASSAPLTLQAGQALTGVDLVLAPAGTVTGTVVDRVTGTPLAGVCPAPYSGRSATYVATAVVTCSDAAGAWSVGGLAQGRYTVQLSPSDGVHQPVWARHGETQRSADLLAVVAGGQAAAGAVRLPRGGSITGRVTDRGGLPVAGATVNFGPYSTFLGDGGSSATTDADGRYTIANVDAGDAIVLTSAFGRPYAWTFSGGVGDPARARKVHVDYGRTTRYDVVLGPEAPLSVVLAGKLPSDWSAVDVFTARGDAVGFHSEADATHPAAGFGLPAGTYRIRLTVSGGAVVWYDGRATLADATPVVLPSAGTTITAHL